MGLTAGDVRARVAASIAQLMGPREWRESPLAFDVFPGTGEGGLFIAAPGQFAVGVIGSEAQPSRQPRSTSPAAGVPTLTELRVRCLSRIRADNQVADYDQALHDEALIMDAAVAVNSNPGLSLANGDLALSLSWSGVVSRRAAVGSDPGSGLFLAEHRFVARHIYPLGGTIPPG